MLSISFSLGGKLRKRKTSTKAKPNAKRFRAETRNEETDIEGNNFFQFCTARMMMFQQPIFI